MFRKNGVLISILVVGLLALTAFSSPYQAAGRTGNTWWVWVFLVLILMLVAWVLLSGRAEEKAAPAAKPEPEAPPPVVEAPEPDDLMRIEGIGPKISQVLQAAGIATFERLAATDASRLEEIVREAGITLADVGTWAEQARLAASGNWDALEALQDELKGGRRE